MLKVWTAQYRYSGEDRFDITAKTKNAFAPPWSFVSGYKNGMLSEKAYEEQYLDLMRKSLKQRTKEWEELLARDEVTVVCFCRTGDFCHRVILAKMLEQLGAKYMGERELKSKRQECQNACNNSKNSYH